MQRKAIAALMISLLLLSACGRGAGEHRRLKPFVTRYTVKLVTMTAQVRVQRGDTVTDYTLTCQELPDGYDLTVTAPEQAAGVTATSARRGEHARL